MRNSREILRQKWALGRTHREVARAVDIGVGTITSVVRRAMAAGLDWAGVETLTDKALEGRLYGAQPEELAAKLLPDPAFIHAERKKDGVTLALLHEEYVKTNPDGYGYTQFCEYYSRWVKKRRLSMRQEHKAGDKAFVDYSGKKPHIVNAVTGEVIEVELFVEVLGASSYTFAEATMTQQIGDWLGSNARGLVYFGGVPKALVPDQLKSAVTISSRYEPEIQRNYADFALHYGTTVMPARPGRPRDKAKVEVAVQVAQRWILARLRNQTFFSLAELNERIAELLEELNGRKMRVYGVSRRELFERLDRPVLMPLPAAPYTLAEWKKAKVNLDYHVEVEHHFYSVPHALVHEEVEVRYSAATVEVFHRGERVTSHVRGFARNGYTTKAEHMPKSHQEHAKWPPSRILSWADTVGPKTRALAEAIMIERSHPEQGYRSCIGILRLAKKYGDARVEAACARAAAAGARSYRHVESILKRGLDRVPTEQPELPEPGVPLSHENVRGSSYYNSKEA